MGRAANQGADCVVLTSDNPRFEEPQAIADDVLARLAEPIAKWITIHDRPAAILRALELAGSADVVVIAGKGHEAEQEVSGVKIPMSDLAIARGWIDRRRRDAQSQCNR